MPNSTLETDVLIVGAGPVGLFLANECARRNLRYRIIEAHESQSVYSKALALFPRTLEILDMAGLVGPFLDVANRVNSVAVISHNRQLANVPFAPEESSYPFIAMVPQDVTERLLVEHLVNAGGRVEYEARFVSAVERRDYVGVDIERKGERSRVRASFVVGCDGAHSSVRHLLNLPFVGKEYKAAFMLADIDTKDSLPANQLQLCPHESGPIAIFPMSATRRRVVAIIKDTVGDVPSLALVRELLAERAPAGIDAQSLRWSSYFRVHHRQVAQLRVGRIFIAGDAAHIHSPFGGQGMNTGLHDIWNLAWKLDLAVRGRGSEELLDSYSRERLPVIKNVIQATDLLTKAMGTPSKLAQALRDNLIPAMSRLAPFQRAFVQRLSGLGINYAGSPIIIGAGKRYFDDSLRGGRGIARQFLLLHNEEANDAARGTLHAIAESFGSSVEERSKPGESITLVRPDGYIAFIAPTRAGSASLTTMRSLLERQVPTLPVTLRCAASSSVNQPQSAAPPASSTAQEQCMTPRIDFLKTDPSAVKAMMTLQSYVNGSGLESQLLELVKLRASQINGCGYCIDMHSKDARAHGETEQRLYALDAWSETPFYSERERAALAWTEAVTLVSDTHIPDAAYMQARQHFDEKELVNLTMAVVAINGWNRLCIALRVVPGTYQVARQS
jgi:AhpD family alkylhydroperoxidase